MRSFEFDKKMKENSIFSTRMKYRQKINSVILSGEPIHDLNENDILLGRGGNNNKYVGNERLRVMSMERVLEYMIENKNGKSEMINSLLCEVRSLDPPGHFLHKGVDDEAWFDAGDDFARGKVAQVFRDAMHAISDEKRLNVNLDTMMLQANSSSSASLDRKESNSITRSTSQTDEIASIQNNENTHDTSLDIAAITNYEDFDAFDNHEIHFNDMDLNENLFRCLDPIHSLVTLESPEIIMPLIETPSMNYDQVPHDHIHSHLKVNSAPKSDHHSSNQSGRAKRSIHHISPSFENYRDVTTISTESTESEKTSLSSTSRREYYYDKAYHIGSNVHPMNGQKSFNSTSLSEISMDKISTIYEGIPNVEVNGRGAATLEVAAFPKDFESIDEVDLDFLDPMHFLEVIEEDDEDQVVALLLS